MKLYEISLQQPHFDALQHDSIFAKWFNISPAGEWRKKKRGTASQHSIDSVH